jgi:transcriptional regulator NrdR family protein
MKIEGRLERLTKEDTMSTIYCSTHKCSRTAHGLISPITRRPLCAQCFAAQSTRNAPQEFQVRVTTDEGDEECFSFTDLVEAKTKYMTQRKEIHKENALGDLAQDIHIELIEVLEMEVIKCTNTSDDL